MKIAIVGPGAIGCLFSGLLSQAGHEVWLIDRRPERARLLDRRGIWVSGVSGEFSARVHATSSPGSVRGVELVVVAVKAYDTADAVRAAEAMLGPATTVLTVQNGIGNIEVLQEALADDRVVGGVTSHGATVIAPGQVHHAGSGSTVVGEPNGEVTERMTSIATAFSAAGLHTELTTDLTSVLWGKLAVNAGINPVATLAEVRNGAIMESTGLRKVLREAVEEVAATARAKGIRLPYPDPAAHAEEICQRTASNLNSMLQDVHRKRRTEVDALNGAVVREGESAGVATPVNRALTALIHGLEETYAARGVR
jgi:2-dehydropantoate 2-reductase